MANEKHGRKSFLGGLLQRSRTSDAQTTPPKHSRTHTAPETPTLLRLPSTASTVASTASRSRRATLTTPETPTAAPSTSAATSPSYFSPQPAASTKEVRSPGTRRPPASHSTGYDTSRGPPVTLITRGNSDIARRPSQQQQQQQQQSQSQSQQQSMSVGPHGSSRRKDEPPQTKTQTPQTKPAPMRRASTSSARPARHMAPSPSPSLSSTDSSDYDAGPASQPRDRDTTRRAATQAPRARPQHTEDLFMNIAEDSAPRQRIVDAAARERLRSRIARVSNRSSFPSGLNSPSPVHSNSNSSTPTASVSRIPYADPKSASQPRRASLLPTTSRHSPVSSTATLETPRTRLPELTSKSSFSSRKDAQLSPQEFLAQFGKKTPSYADANNTPPTRLSAYRPSNLNYSSARDDPKTPQADSFPEGGSRADGTESHGSTGPATSVWDELDELKTRIRRIELVGKIPSTSGAVVSQATSDRPRTANTSATTVSSSPNQPRKSAPSSSGSTIDTQTPSRTHPLLREALAKVRQHTSPDVYRRLEAIAAEALAMADLTGSAGPQGTLNSTSSVVGGAVVPDRQIRRKADNICRGLTELCITLCDTKSSLSSPAVRASAIAASRRPSVQVNGESPPVRQSIEPESNSLPGVSPSRALTRIEARRTSMIATGSLRESSQDRDRADSRSYSRQRAGTSLHRARQSVDDDDEDDPTIRAPSRAMTDFRNIRSAEKPTTTTSRFSSRNYTSQEPMPGLQPSPAIQPTSGLRRPTVTGSTNENSLLYRDSTRRYNFDREGSPAHEKQMAGNLQARTQFSNRANLNRNSIGTMNDIGRSVSLGGRRLRGASIGE
ncbi:hypothetical protein P153DRAFT_389215 [Dothidotthia symphoricarpi CBS 119687]|uniref:Uncharacterized protein n=1 Tax=Dothidotthia symphoricarpi CBS 119687 TaxID=1392245 RepID=A0A6A6A3L0_9PLEO|nr:uncharacterized protein P153DRAFT_389215 [Dothidotthia symphoricarpi CBS 119687]KAF2125765.1 hypothetical protein P153DRAFT_389215 [Dothidotthia symphoricarpi CBS 119687]